MELPAQFSERINKIDNLLTKFTAAADEKEKEEALRLALVTSCELLRSIDMELLRGRLKEIFAEADASESKWRSIILDDKGHFEFFLKNIEDKFLKHIGLNENARN
jgi:hypothetical protein